MKIDHSTGNFNATFIEHKINTATTNANIMPIKFLQLECAWFKNNNPKTIPKMSNIPTKAYSVPLSRLDCVTARQMFIFVCSRYPAPFPPLVATPVKE